MGNQEDNYHPDIPEGVNPYDKAHLTISLNFLDRITGKKKVRRKGGETMKEELEALKAKLEETKHPKGKKLVEAAEGLVKDAGPEIGAVAKAAAELAVREFDAALKPAMLQYSKVENGRELLYALADQEVA